MKKFNRIISTVLAVLMLVGCLTTVMVFPAAADIVGGTPTTGNYIEALSNAYAQKYSSGAEKIENDPNMVLMAKNGSYELYCNRFTGEVAYKNTVTGKVLTSNPVNLSSVPDNGKPFSDTSDNTRAELLSQLEVVFMDNEGKEQSFFSYGEAAYRNQISVTRMNKGFRVEYTMGRLNTTYLYPGVVLEEDFEYYVLNVLDALMEQYEGEFGRDSEAYQTVYEYYRHIDAWYTTYDYDEDKANGLDVSAMQAKYPVYKEGVVLRVLNDIVDAEKVLLESMIKTYCTDINQDTLDEMHSVTGYVQVNNETPVFRMAIEYVLENDGLSVRLPATSIRFDESKYTLRYIKMLEFFGAGNLNNDGYVFFPDGSGALVEFKDFYSTAYKESVSLTSSIYGEDYAYYDIDPDAKHSEVVRMPVYGMVETKGGVSTGFLAIMEEGDALADIGVTFGGGDYNFASVYASFFPRPYDAYNLSEAISVANNEEMTIVSEKKYTGFYKTKYIMLADDSEEALMAEAGQSYYEADYVGMAAAYRDYLVDQKIISKFTEEDVRENNLPLYIETLGSVETTKRILSIPFEVNAPLTSFEDVALMYDRLKDNKITNVNFKLTGYANGGMNSAYPKSLKWVNAVGGKAGFRELLAYAKEENFGIYPEFDFSYISRANANGVNLRKTAARAVDDRYCSKQVYNAVYQEYSSLFEICVSPDSILKYVERFEKKYSKYDPIGISVSTLGSDLNSNFDKDNTYNREDAQDLVCEALESVRGAYGSVMAEGGNIYSVQFLDHILNAPIDSSRKSKESKAVPFLGMVLHGYVNYAGSAINKSGDGDYQLLKSIESGALLYYIMAYENTNLLKDDYMLSQYYSVRFDIWLDTIIEQYETLNGAIGDLQLYTIVDHDFLIGERLQSASEKETEKKTLEEQVLSHLQAQYTQMVEQKHYEMRITQTVQNLVNAGYVTREALIVKLFDLLLLDFNSDWILNPPAESDPVKMTPDEEAFRNSFIACELAIIDSVLADYSASVPFQKLNGESVKVYVNLEALLASVEAVCGFEWSDDEREAFSEELQKLTKNAVQYPTEADIVIDSLTGFEIHEQVTDSFATDGKDYVYTEYTSDADMIVWVSYSNGEKTVSFILNYNDFDVSVRLRGVNGEKAFTVPAGSFCRINGTELVIND